MTEAESIMCDMKQQFSYFTDCISSNLTTWV